jgi:hypothetical protein
VGIALENADTDFESIAQAQRPRGPPSKSDSVGKIACSGTGARAGDFAHPAALRSRAFTVQRQAP